VLGPEELTRGSVGVKFLDEDLGQVTLPQGELAAYLRQALGQRGISLTPSLTLPLAKGEGRGRGGESEGRGQ
jgi:hypothetical protein